MKTTQVIVNADDLGLSLAVNEAVQRAFRHGTLQSASLMATGDAFLEAAELARDNPGLSVGIHLVTVMGRAVLPHREIPHITDARGRFPDNPLVAGIRYCFSGSSRRELFKELEAQFERFCSAGLTPTHVDSHLHMHVHPVVFRAALTLAQKYGVKRMRVPVDDLFLALRFDRSAIPRKMMEAFLFRVLTRPMKRRVDALGLMRCERVFGHLLSGRMTEEYVLAVLQHVRAGSNEIYFHPAFYGHGEANLPPEKLQGVTEYRILTGNRLLTRLTELRKAHESNAFWKGGR